MHHLNTPSLSSVLQHSAFQTQCSFIVAVLRRIFLALFLMLICHSSPKTERIMSVGWNVALGDLWLKLYLGWAMNQREIFELKWTVTVCFPGLIFTKRMFAMAACLHRGPGDDTIYFRPNIFLCRHVHLRLFHLEDLSLEAINTPVLIIAGLARQQILTER